MSKKTPDFIDPEDAFKGEVLEVREDAKKEAEAIKSHPIIRSDDLAEIDSWDDAQKLFKRLGVDAPDAADVAGDGFTGLRKDDKERLIGTECLCMSWSFVQSDDTGSEYVLMNIITKAGEKYRVSDGGAGIYRQMLRYSKDIGCYPDGGVGLWMRRGFRASKYYEAKDRDGNAVLGDNGKPVKARTFYIDTSN